MTGPRTPNTALESYASLPSVTFDIKLGKQLSFIDFDYSAYIDHQRGLGISDESINDGALEIRVKQPYELVQGAINLETLRIWAGIHRLTSARRVNSIIHHELDHKAKIIEGSVGEAALAKQNKQIKLFNWGVLTTFGGLGVEIIIGNTTESDVIGSAGSVVSGAGLLMMLAATQSYLRTDHEKTAKTAQKNKSAFISFRR